MPPHRTKNCSPPETGALGGLAADAIFRRDGERGAIVALVLRHVPAALPLTSADALSHLARGAIHQLEVAPCPGPV